MRIMDELVRIVVSTPAVWLATLLGIAAAAVAEKAFNASSEAEPPDRWRGEDSYSADFEQKEEIAERTVRDALKSQAAALQSVSTLFAAGAAIEAAAASQAGPIGVVLTAAGLIVAIVPAISRWVKASREIEYTKAWYCRLAWSGPRKYIRMDDPAAEDEAFAEEHPYEAKILKRQVRS
jgi:hypothetical protein